MRADFISQILSAWINWAPAGAFFVSEIAALVYNAPH
jgi:hypothetical protein